NEVRFALVPENPGRLPVRIRPEERELDLVRPELLRIRRKSFGRKGDDTIAVLFNLSHKTDPTESPRESRRKCVVAADKSTRPRKSQRSHAQSCADRRYERARGPSASTESGSRYRPCECRVGSR